MYKLCAAIVAVAAAGIAGAFFQPHADAQETEEKPSPIYTWTTPAQSGYYQLLGADKPGTWQIVEADRRVLLLNTANGETYHLAEADGGLTWKEIPRPRAAAPTVLPRSRIVPLPLPQPGPESVTPPDENTDK